MQQQPSRLPLFQSPFASLQHAELGHEPKPGVGSPKSQIRLEILQDRLPKLLFIEEKDEVRKARKKRRKKARET